MWVQENEAVILQCTNDTSDTNYGVLWYKQPSSGKMVLLIRQDSYNQQNATEGRFSIEFPEVKQIYQACHLSFTTGGLNCVFLCTEWHSEKTVGGRCTKTQKSA
jgi:hypothetical protein